ncbi:MAG TPA: hypothetical protein D7I03_05925 [Candidatus Poseidoniales archaeon]|mgnify:FL=1|nr:MAG TPA: hypothetical protein D7I03_05925 [Candidatus Poseidoniales archaeon]HII50861.1 hypothetical protein [Candidatus Poseidoniaceae archaeon]|tara:strand:+ start:4291 stop:5232 length:942 start_codon:yes stop_codon:yes gene_type:complete
MSKFLTYSLALIFLLQALSVVQAQNEDEQQNIVEVANGTGSHDVLVAALTHVGLDQTLIGDGPFTVFAPTDQAFEDAGVNLDDYDTDSENETLRNILLYHVISGAAVEASDVTDGMTADAANGDSLVFAVDGENVSVGDAAVTTADVEASNGIIHVIDKILIPPAEEPVSEEITDDCDVTIGIDDSGYAYDKDSVNINVGDTVCWKWTESDMPHNVAEIAEIGSNERLAGGVYSGAAEETVDFSYTFTENTTFYYACEPHITMGMKGEVIVGTGIDANKAESNRGESESTPGFIATASIAALIGAAAFISKRD